MRKISKISRLIIACIIFCLSFPLAACSTGHDATSIVGNFEFVSPHGETVISYNPPAARKYISHLEGNSLTSPGQKISLTDFPHKIVVLNIWGSWCGPCRGEADVLERIAQEYHARDVRFLGINFRDNAAAARDFVHDRQITYPSIFDPSGRSILALHGIPTAAIPVTIVLDRHHRVAKVFLRPVLTDDLHHILDRLIKED